jgi:hypothetical protein
MPNIPLNKLIDILRHRVPWAVMKPLFQHHQLKKGRGWEDTISKLEDFAASKNQEKESLLIGILSKIYQEHLIVGEKTTRFYWEKQDKVKQLINALLSYDIPDSSFSKSYPYPLEENELSDLKTEVYLVKILKQHEKLLLVFCSKRHIKERVEIIPEQQDSEVKEALAEFYEVIGFKKYDKQFFDIIVLNPKTNTIEVRIDISSNISSEDKEICFRQVKIKFQELISELTNEQYKLDNAINLFPAINQLYRSNEGRVCELAFTTEGSSIKHEKMRRRHECLRTEAYHQGGSQAVDGQISAYRIAATWEHRTNATLVTQPELLLPGHHSMLNTNAPLTDATITNCAGIADYDFVVGKLNGFLGQNEPTA